MQTQVSSNVRSARTLSAPVHADPRVPVRVRVLHVVVDEIVLSRAVDRRQRRPFVEGEARRVRLQPRLRLEPQGDGACVLRVCEHPSLRHLGLFAHLKFVFFEEVAVGAELLPPRVGARARDVFGSRRRCVWKVRRWRHVPIRDIRTGLRALSG